jgi:3-hydroxy-9,10-secoandrosta-1,3,5(10)-triene-9,17-dione monooxygenase
VPGPQLGLARAALDFVVEQAHHRGVSYTIYDKQADAPTVQLAVGDAAATIAAAEAVASALTAEIMTVAREGRSSSVADRARMRAESAFATRAARDAIRTLVSAHGASSFAESNVLQRIWRDAEVLSRHAFALYETATEVYGKVLLGSEPLPTALV